MALQLSKQKPRSLQYSAGGLRCDLRLIEIDEKLLQSVIDSEVVIKGESTDDAVLCTANKTYALKLVETTNTLLLLPSQQELDEDFSAIPSLTPSGTDAAEPRDVGLQTQLRKNAAALGLPPLTATATVNSHIELVEIAPNLDHLPKLLGERPYSLEDEEPPPAAAAAAAAAAAPAAAGGDGDGGGGGDDVSAMDVDGHVQCNNSSNRSNRLPGCFTTDELLDQVQASESELLSELRRLGALQLGGVWRRVDESYLGGLLEMMVVCAQEHGWSLGRIPVQQAVTVLQQEGYLPELVQHCLQVFGSPVQPEEAAAAAAAAAGPADSSSPESPSSQGRSRSSSSSHYALDEQLVCLQYARKLLSQHDFWQLSDFMTAWHAALPDCWHPREDMLLGEALLLLPEPGEGYSEPRLRHFPARLLPSAPGPRFAALFAAQPRWTREQLDPYLAGLKVPGQTVEQLLLRYARACQRTPTDPTLVFVTR